ncbi:hypothetical protein OsI_35962 [Oryza sativa Indica Group]|uniref:Uncharacterized protein n=1 Tax=Oryza sativa subsp. indica TaxID=39946 RepID=A2ZDU8_ORYSI|nr:hypothetical protein OsI_35962 [Oryza sativa Indica Group]
MTDKRSSQQALTEGAVCHKRSAEECGVGGQRWEPLQQRVDPLSPGTLMGRSGPNDLVSARPSGSNKRVGRGGAKGITSGEIPLYVATKMSPVQGNSPFIPSPEEYAKAAVRCIGYEPRCVPYWRHSIQWFFASLLPDSVLNLWRLQVGIRKRNQMKVLLGESDHGFS